ncbi:MAG: pyroglutamyl-peptidase I [Cetobacterium sp.]|uniref:Pyrrolidone-carboxylate peptidase n=1 Tax=Cetobacterium ceti TaxID=180163 RepID=A0A1T4KJJ0_9FUSO|nr:pyroglutamyl-peptidase I [Cetobacterium ceti]MCJ8342053.1 pyroglutamyl-peptidase I [Cetobacterium sp.]SJZ42533.1 pyroglutamyl-peptidase [Cetobacterium ceti]
MRVLITGFDPFGGEKINPAWEAVKGMKDRIGEIEIIKLEIPTVFHKATEVLVEGAKACNPDVIIAIGQAGGRYDITPERVAINIDDARIKDNDGAQPIDVKIYEDGENAYFTNLPIKAMVEAMKKEGIPASVSNTAGTFVCNHIMYSIMYHITKNNLAKKGGFIHVPYIPEQVVDKKNVPYMEKSRITKALEIAIEALGENEKDIKAVGGTEF